MLILREKAALPAACGRTRNGPAVPLVRTAQEFEACTRPGVQMDSLDLRAQDPQAALRSRCRSGTAR